MKETWRTIPLFDGYYKISSRGRMKSMPRKFSPQVNFITPSLNSGGYPTTMISYNGATQTIAIHRMVALAFIPNPEDKPYINHKNGVKNDNRVENLEWCTQSENIQHAFDSGSKTQHKGELHPMSRLTETDVLSIREKYKGGNYTQNMLVADFGVSYSTIQKILYRKIWTHI